MRKGRPRAELALSEGERAQLVRGARAAHSTQAYALRCRIVLACADGITNGEVAARFGVSLPTVGKWRSRFLARRMPGLADEPRAGRPATIRQDQVEQLVAATFDSPPERTKRWSRASMATHSGLSASTVGRIWRRFDLRPHLQDGFRLIADPQFVVRVVDVVGLYQNAPARAVALCTDEGPWTGAPDRFRLAPPTEPDLPGGRTRGPGTRGPVPAPDTTGGPVAGEPGRRRRTHEYRGFLLAIHTAVPAELDVHVLCDNVDIHSSATMRSWLARHPRFHIHFTPAGPSWITQTERWFALFGENIPHPDLDAATNSLETDVHACSESRSQHPKPVVWKKSAEDIRDSLARHLQRISGASTPTGLREGLT
ncbi:IS630 family transposase [Micromonospora sp. RTGN7]|uniref:IS630 family transposase n=1 Tax=Micromonospora sp. RTGN7 TaxID=3016526 RepID=UPI0029FEFB51|nr:IS630 family transposase [Micromonospora sp. RTGN7]